MDCRKVCAGEQKGMSLASRWDTVRRSLAWIAPAGVAEVGIVVAVSNSALGIEIVLDLEGQCAVADMTVRVAVEEAGIVIEEVVVWELQEAVVAFGRKAWESVEGLEAAFGDRRNQEEASESKRNQEEALQGRRMEAERTGAGTVDVGTSVERTVDCMEAVG